MTINKWTNCYMDEMKFMRITIVLLYKSSSKQCRYTPGYFRTGIENIFDAFRGRHVMLKTKERSRKPFSMLRRHRLRVLEKHRGREKGKTKCGWTNESTARASQTSTKLTRASILRRNDRLRSSNCCCNSLAELEHVERARKRTHGPFRVIVMIPYLDKKILARDSEWPHRRRTLLAPEEASCDKLSRQQRRGVVNAFKKGGGSWAKWTNLLGMIYFTCSCSGHFPYRQLSLFAPLHRQSPRSGK